METTRFRTKESIELELFEEIEIPENMCNDDYTCIDQDRRWPERIIGNSICIAKVTKSEDGKSILMRRRRSIYSQPDEILIATANGTLPVDSYVMITRSRKVISGITTELLDEIINQGTRILNAEYKGQSLVWKIDQDYFDFSESTDPEDFKEHVTKLLNLAKDSIDVKEKRDIEIEEKTRKEQEDWIANGKFKNIDGKEIEFGQNAKIKVEKMWKEILPFRTSWTQDLSSILTHLENYGYEGDIIISMGPKIAITARIEAHGSKIGDISVRKDRVYPLMRRLWAGEIDMEDIATYNRLSGIKMDLAKTSKIRVERGYSLADVPVIMKVRFMTQKKVRISMFGKDKEFDWSTAKEIFTVGRSIRNRLSPQSYFDLAKRFGLDKPKALAKLKQYATLGEI